MPEEYKNKDWLENEYKNNKKTMKEISEDQKVSWQTINYWMKKYRIERRSENKKNPNKILGNMIQCDTCKEFKIYNKENFIIYKSSNSKYTSLNTCKKCYNNKRREKTFKNTISFKIIEISREICMINKNAVASKDKLFKEIFNRINEDIGKSMVTHALKKIGIRNLGRYYKGIALKENKFQEKVVKNKYSELDNSEACKLLSCSVTSEKLREILIKFNMNDENSYRKIDIEECIERLHELERFFYKKNIYRSTSCKIAIILNVYTKLYQHEIRDLTGVTEVSMRNNAKKFEKFLNR